MVQGYSLASAWGAWYGPVAMYLAMIWQIMVATSEHFTHAVPAFDYLAFKYDFFFLAGAEFLTIIYLAYCNPRADDKSSNERKIMAWFIGIALTTVMLVYLGQYPIDPLTPEHYLSLFQGPWFNAWHLYGHFFYMGAFAFVSTYTKFERSPSKGVPVNVVAKQLGGVWKKLKEHQVKAKFGLCVLAAALTAAINYWGGFPGIVAAELDGDISLDPPFFPPWCKVRVSFATFCSTRLHLFSLCVFSSLVQG